jgi:hypothetical protein
MQYCRFEPKTLCSLTRDTTPPAVLSDHVAVNPHRRATADLAAPAAVEPQPVHAPLPVAPPYHLRHPACDLDSRQLFHHRPLPPALDAVHRDQVALMLPTYVARPATRAQEDAARRRRLHLDRVPAPPF